ncbi:MAG: LysM peptidoglycan-binding domain-containing protein [Gemmatimonadota bacterium]
MTRISRAIAGVAAVAIAGCASPPDTGDPKPARPAVEENGAAPLARADKSARAVDTVAATPAEVESELRELFGAADLASLSEKLETAADTPSWDIPITINSAVERWLEYFQNDGRENFEIYLIRAGRYEPMMRAMFRDAGLPEDLVYMSLIESGFSPRAYSRARAVGLWQFIASTGRRYDLGISYWVDERRDPILATKAAVAHLTDLYEEFNSWYLAAAAYNAGPTRVRRSIRRSGSEDFWTLAQRRYLRRETRNYVPKLIAAALMAKQPEKYGFTGFEPHAPMAYEVVEVPDATSLDVVARAAGVEAAAVAQLNPQILRGVTPPGERYQVRVPPGRSQDFATNYAAVPPSERVTWVLHVVRRGDTLGEIGQAYGVSVASIRAANKNVRPRRLRVGQRLVIPRAGRIPRYNSTTVTARTRSSRRATTPQRPDGPYVTYKVLSGDSLWTIARQYAGVTTRDLMRWNGLRSSRIYPGDEMRIYTDESQ